MMTRLHLGNNVCVAREGDNIVLSNLAEERVVLTPDMWHALTLYVVPDSTKDVRAVLDDYLRAHGYDGLMNGYAECACEVGDLAPCDGPCLECEPGVKAPCDCGDHDFHIVAGKFKSEVTGG